MAAGPVAEVEAAKDQPQHVFNWTIPATLSGSLD